MVRNLMEAYAELPLIFRRPLWRIWHNYLVSRDKSFEIKFMNYGFVDLSENPFLLDLQPEDEPERYCINLYHQDVSEVDLKGKDVLEVGCGRGGGASYISRYLNPNSYVGVDLSKKAIRFCNRHYKIPGLSFIKGKAEELPFEDEKFDAIVNVESSRCYADMDAFLSEVYRCLKPKGHLLFSDMRTKEGNEELKKQFEEANLSIVKEKFILPNVVAALKLDTERRRNLTKAKAPKFLHKSVDEFTGVVGSKRFQLFEDGTIGYYGYVLSKN